MASMNSQQRKMIGHGSVVILLGLVAGFGLTMSLIGGFEIFPGHILEFNIPGNHSAWARAHAGGLMNGMLVMLVALLMYAMRIEGPTANRLYWMMVGTGYANSIFYLGGLLSQTRALTFGDNQFGETSLIGMIGLVPALVFSVVTTIAFIIIAREAFSSAAQPTRK